MNRLLYIILIAVVSVSVQAKRVEIYGHRGAAGLSPENTISGYKTALMLGVDVLDMDVVLTKDKQVILAHDSFVNPYLTKEKNNHWLEKTNLAIRSLKLQELQCCFTVGELKPESDYALKYPYQSGYLNEKMPSLREVFQYIEKQTNKDVRYQIELKSAPDDEMAPDYHQLVDAVVDLVKEFSLDNKVEIQSFDFRALLYTKKVAPKLSLSFVTQKNTKYDNYLGTQPGFNPWTAGAKLKNHKHSVPQMIHDLGGDLWNPHYKDLTPQLVQQAHRLGLRVVPWTVDSENIMQRMITYQVDGIITNRPDKLLGLLAAKNMR